RLIGYYTDNQSLRSGSDAAMQRRFHPSILAFGSVLLVGTGASLLGGCGQSGVDRSASAAEGTKKARTVGVVAPAVGDVPRVISQPGTILGIEEAALYAKPAGYLKMIPVDKGDRVKAGQVLAVIQSPELHFQQAQAQATYQQSMASAQGAVAAKGRAEADVEGAKAAVARAEADARQADATVGRSQADLAKAQAQVPKLQAAAQEADASVQQTAEEQARAQADVGRWQEQLKAAQASLRATQAARQKAVADAHLQDLTYNRYKA